MNFLSKVKRGAVAFLVQIALLAVTAVTLIFLWQTESKVGKILCLCALVLEADMLAYFFLCATNKSFSRTSLVLTISLTATAVLIVGLFAVLIVGKMIIGSVAGGYNFMALIFAVTLIIINILLFLRLKSYYAETFNKAFIIIMVTVMVVGISAPTIVAMLQSDVSGDYSYLQAGYKANLAETNTYRVYPDVTAQVTADFSDEKGTYNPINGVNNGPSNYSVFDNTEDYKAAGFPFVRLADGLNYSYSGWNGYNHEIDVNAIFKDFSMDENDPASYTFVATDAYMKRLSECNSKVIYRLGCDCELGMKKVDSIPPADAAKWARICEHIIAHYNEKWADGFEYGIEYWEIWSGADQTVNDEKAYWQGSDEEFYSFFATAFGYLKNRFPTLKIGGASVSDVNSGGFGDELLSAMDEQNLKLDFFSYRCFTSDVNDFYLTANAAASLLSAHGQNSAELILSEWNYSEGLSGEDYLHTVQAIKSIYGASFSAAALSELSKSGVDTALYYEARRSGLNGLFASDDFACLKTYYVFQAFSNLYKAGTIVQSEASDGIYTSAAKGNGKYYLALTYYKKQLSARAKTTVSFLGLADKAYSVNIRLLDETHDLETVTTYTLTSERAIELTLNPYEFYLVEIAEI